METAVIAQLGHGVASNPGDLLALRGHAKSLLVGRLYNGTSST